MGPGLVTHTRKLKSVLNVQKTRLAAEEESLSVRFDPP